MGITLWHDGLNGISNHDILYKTYFRRYYYKYCLTVAGTSFGGVDKDLRLITIS